MDAGALTGATSPAPIAFDIRDESEEDAPGIAEVLRFAFGGNLEVDLVASLRRQAELAAALVAHSSGLVIGYVAFARATVTTEVGSDPVAWLAPLAVSPPFQGQGIGGDLVRAGLLQCRSRGFAHAVVLGEPSYYARFGFSRAAAERLRSRWRSPALMAISLGDPSRRGLAGELSEPASFVVFG